MVPVANTETQPFRSRLMDPKETAEYLKLDEKTITRWARKAYLPAHPLGEGKRKFWRFCEEELSVWLSSQSNGVDQPAASLSVQSVRANVNNSINTAKPRVHSATFVNGNESVVHIRPRRYQRGSLSIMKHRSTPDVWAFRYYTNENGRRVYKRKTIGTVLELPRRKDAEAAVSQLRIEVNEKAGIRPITVEELAAHFRSVEMPLKAYSTREGYKNILNLRVIPRWGQYNLLSIESMEVEHWLRNLITKDGRSASPATKSKVRNQMSALFSHAIRYGWVTRNPITPVRSSAKRLRQPETLSPSEFRALLGELPQREHLMVLLAGSTGLRRGELIGLRWGDVDFGQKLVNVTRSVWHNIEGETKTAASRKPVPLQPAVIREMKLWRKKSPYSDERDFLFPSIVANGKHPVEPGMILRNYIQPALIHLNVKKRIGWHSFRHGFSNLLRQKGVDIKTAQELLRHANSRVTLDVYQQSVTKERRRAQAAAFEALIGKSQII